MSNRGVHREPEYGRRETGNRGHAAFDMTACERAVYTKEERDSMIATGKPIVFLGIGELASPIINGAEDYKAISLALIDFMELRKKYVNIFFIMDYVPPQSKLVSMEFWYDRTHLQSIRYYINTYQYPSAVMGCNTDIEIIEGINKIMGKILERETGMPVFASPSER